MRILVLLLLLAATEAAMAARGIPAPYVEEGKNVFFTDALYDIDSEASKQIYRQRFTLDTAVTDKLMLRYRVNFDDPAGDELHFDRFEFGGWYELAEKGEWAIDTALYLAYIADTQADREFLQPRILMAKDYGDMKFVSQFLFQRELNEGDSNSDTNVQYNITALFKVDENSFAGIDYFGDFGAFNDLSNYEDRAHLLGPTYSHSLEGTNIRLFTSGLVGLTSNSPDFSFEWGIAYTF